MTINVSTLLDVALSLVFIFFTFSLFVSGIVEFINTFRNQRSRTLKLALIKALDQKEINKTLRQMAGKIDSKWDTVAPTFARFWDHPLVRVKRQIDLRRFVGDKPISYLNAESFSTVVLDILASAAPVSAQPGESDEKQATKLMLARIRQTVANPNPVEKPTGAALDLTALTSLVGPLLEKSDTFTDLKTALEHWYDGYMEQVSGWFKRNTQAIVWGISIIVTVAMNVDTLRITRQLFMDPKLRDNLVMAAERTVNQQAANAYSGRQQNVNNKPVNSTAISASTVISNRDSARTTPTGSSTVVASTTATVDTAVAVRTKSIPIDSLFVVYIQEVDPLFHQRLDYLQKDKLPLTPTDSLQLRAIYIRYAKKSIDDLNLPIGWTLRVNKLKGFEKFKEHCNQICSQISWLGIIGWALTATALSFGAPFWFDLLLKLVNIRNVAKKPASSVVPDK